MFDLSCVRVQTDLFPYFWRISVNFISDNVNKQVVQMSVIPSAKGLSITWYFLLIIRTKPLESLQFSSFSSLFLLYINILISQLANFYSKITRNRLKYTKIWSFKSYFNHLKNTIKPSPTVQWIGILILQIISIVLSANATFNHSLIVCLTIFNRINFQPIFSIGPWYEENERVWKTKSLFTFFECGFETCCSFGTAGFFWICYFEYYCNIWEIRI